MFSLIILGCILFAHGEWVTQMENDGLYEGDIVLDPDQKLDLEKSHNGFATLRTNHWPSGKPIPYYIEGSIGSGGIRAIKSAIADYEKHTCLRFRAYKNGDRGYISFFKGGGCFSPVGYRGGRNRISLGSGCQTKGIAVHEIGHTLGIFHEQARPDRDNFVKILWDNIADGKKSQFYKQGSNINSYGTPYDYESVMHYGATSFGKRFLIFGKKTTIETLNKNYQNKIGQRRGLSTIDIKQINLMYNCPRK